jgi:hypothetical protein
MLTEMQSFREKGWKLLSYSGQQLGMLLKAVGRPLGTATKVQESHRKMPEGCRKASRRLLKGTGKLLGNAKIPNARLQERRQNCSAAIGKNMAISVHFR